jgi:methionyl-tRNA formyltransferase
VNGAVLKLLEVAPSVDEPNLPAGTILQREKTVLVGTQTEPLVLLRVQPAGKTAMTANDWWRGVSAESVIAS